jgi:TonB family protein
MRGAAILMLVFALFSILLPNSIKAHSLDRDIAELPKITSAPLPAYPEEARINKVEGAVLLNVVLHSSGKVTKIIPLKELPYGLTQESIAAARKIKFQVGRLNGKAVSVYWKLRYTFSLSNGVSVNTAPDQ